MSPPAACPVCGGVQLEGLSCEQHFHELLFWENQQPDLGVVHHLLVLCYHLQHPHLYSQAGLANALQLLIVFLRHGADPQAVRQQNGARVDSGNRTWKVTSTPDDFGSYPHQQEWSVTIQDVAAGGPQDYVANVRMWAEAILADLEAAGSVPGGAGANSIR